MLWWVGGDSARLGPTARAEIGSAANRKFVSQASLWEIALKARIGKLDGDVAEIAAAIAADRFRVFDIATVHLVRLSALTVFDDHRDPFDHLIIATALAEGCAVMTSDGKFARYGVPVVDPGH